VALRLNTNKGEVRLEKRNHPPNPPSKGEVMSNPPSKGEMDCGSEAGMIKRGRIKFDKLE